MATIDEGAARKKLPSQEYYDAYERIYGWECFYCRTRTKEPNCPNCKRSREEAKR